MEVRNKTVVVTGTATVAAELQATAPACQCARASTPAPATGSIWEINVIEHVYAASAVQPQMP